MPLSGPNVVLWEKKGRLAFITLNRPERMNALSVEAANKLDDIWRKIESDEDIRVAVLTGAGDRAFCTGMDMKEQVEIKEKTGEDVVRDLFKDPMLQNIRKVTKPLIAAINGLALGGGFLLAQSCDLRVAVSDARFGIPEVKVGRGSPWAVPLLWMLPVNIALELTLTGEFIDAQRLYQINYLNRVVSRDQLMPTATRMAEAISENAPLSVRAAKKTFYRAMDLGGCQKAFEEALNKIYPLVYDSEDAAEGPRAFAEKRKPVWKGK
jgi:enoyl-CoA hydratase